MNNRQIELPQPVIALKFNSNSVAWLAFRRPALAATLLLGAVLKSIFMQEKKEISKETYYHAMALFMIANRKQKEVSALENEMNEILGEENGSHFSDAIYESNNGNEKDFQSAMRKANFVVSK